MGYLTERRPLFSGEERAKEGLRRAFHAQQRERVAQPIPTQPREITLGRREARKLQRRMTRSYRAGLVRLDAERKRQWHREARARRKAVAL